MSALMDGSEHSIDECNFRTTFGKTNRWGELPVSIYTHSSVLAEEDRNLEHAVDIWNEAWHYHSEQGVLFEIIGSVDHKMPDEKLDKTNTFYVERDAVGTIFPLKEQAITRTNSSYVTGLMNDGDIIINGEDFEYFYEDDELDYSKYTNVPALSTARRLASTFEHSFWTKWLMAIQSFMKKLVFWKPKVAGRKPSSKPKRIPKDEIDFISLCIHELGHLLGMVHEEQDNANIMYPSLAKAQIRRKISRKDLKRVSCGYSK